MATTPPLGMRIIQYMHRTNLLELFGIPITIITFSIIFVLHPCSFLLRNKANSNDQTLEILMTDLDPEKMKCFYKDQCPTAAMATKVFD